MRVEAFEKSLKGVVPPEEASVQVQALWWNAKGDWQKAHDLIDHLNDQVSAHIHAYLHRAEGDLWNARYWYRKADQPEYKGSLEEELAYLVDRYVR